MGIELYHPSKYIASRNILKCRIIRTLSLHLRIPKGEGTLSAYQFKEVQKSGLTCYSCVMEKKLTWEEIKKQYDQEWVELIDYDWPDEEPDPRAGIVRVHAKTRSQFDDLADQDPPFDSAYVFVGQPKPTEEVVVTRGYSSIVVGPDHA